VEALDVDIMSRALVIEFAETFVVCTAVVVPMVFGKMQSRDLASLAFEMSYFNVAGYVTGVRLLLLSVRAHSASPYPSRSWRYVYSYARSDVLAFLPNLETEDLMCPGLGRVEM
jgi:hypothetical protein